MLCNRLQTPAASCPYARCHPPFNRSCRVPAGRLHVMKCTPTPEQTSVVEQGHNVQRLQQVSLLQEALDGTFWSKAKLAAPEIPWGPRELLQVMLLGISAAAVLAVASSGLALGTATTAREAAVDHVLSELLLATIMPAVVILSLQKFNPLSRGLLSARWDSQLLLQTTALCAVVFPIVDPLINSVWQPAVTAALGQPAASAYVESLQQAAEQNDLETFALQLVASSVFTPLWEEMFWRGFFLASLTKVVPLPLAVAMSSLNFAMLHLNAYAFLPLIVLSACCDALYVRTFNLLPGIAFHGLWNAYQLVAIFFFHKKDFV